MYRTQHKNPAENVKRRHNFSTFHKNYLQHKIPALKVKIQILIGFWADRMYFQTHYYIMIFKSNGSVKWKLKMKPKRKCEINPIYSRTDIVSAFFDRLHMLGPQKLKIHIWHLWQLNLCLSASVMALKWFTILIFSHQIFNFSKFNCCCKMSLIIPTPIWWWQVWWALVELPPTCVTRSLHQDGDSKNAQKGKTCRWLSWWWCSWLRWRWYQQCGWIW